MSKPATLHLLLSACPEAWRDCLQASQASDTVVLLDEGVLGLMHHEVVDGAGSCRMLVSAADLQARMGSLPADAGGMALVTDAELIGQITAHDRCVSWR